MARKTELRPATNRAVHIEDQLLERATLADAVHPLTRYCDQGGEVVRVGEHLSLEASDLVFIMGLEVGS
jgi:hypothetical protein